MLGALTILRSKIHIFVIDAPGLGAEHRTQYCSKNPHCKNEQVNYHPQRQELASLLDRWGIWDSVPTVLVGISAAIQIQPIQVQSHHSSPWLTAQCAAVYKARCKLPHLVFKPGAWRLPHCIAGNRIKWLSQGHTASKAHRMLFSNATACPPSRINQPFCQKWRDPGNLTSYS